MQLIGVLNRLRSRKDPFVADVSAQQNEVHRAAGSPGISNSKSPVLEFCRRCTSRTRSGKDHMAYPTNASGINGGAVPAARVREVLLRVGGQVGAGMTNAGRQMTQKKQKDAVFARM